MEDRTLSLHPAHCLGNFQFLVIDLAHMDGTRGGRILDIPSDITSFDQRKGWADNASWADNT